MAGCVAYGCTNRTDGQRKPGVTYHLFPKDAVRRKAWILAIKRRNFTPTRFSRLCSEHFAEECFDRSSKHFVRLKQNAVPTVFKNYPESLQNVAKMAPLTEFISGETIVKIESEEEEEEQVEENIDDESLSESQSSEEESSSEEEPPETNVVYVSEEKNEGDTAAKPPRIIKVVSNTDAGGIQTPSKANLDKKILSALSSYMKYQECADTEEAADTEGGPTVSVIFVEPPPDQAYPLIPTKDGRAKRKPNNLEYRIINQTRKIRAMNQMNERYQAKITQLERIIENFKNPATSDEDVSDGDITLDEIYHEMLKRQRLDKDVES